MKRSSLKLRLSPESATHARAATAELWHDEADDEEWNAWTDHTHHQSPTGAEDEDDFGAWVDATDSPTSTGYHTPIGTSFADEYTAPDASVMTLRQLRRLNVLEHSAQELGSLDTGAPSTSGDATTQLYLNPWENDNIISKERLAYDANEYDESGDIDPEIDSAMAFSAWESALSRSDRTRDEDEDDDEDLVFDAWDGGSRFEFQEVRPVGDTRFSVMQSNGGNSQALSDKEVKEEPAYALDWYTGEDGLVEPPQRRSPTWMQRLTGSQTRPNRGR